MSDKTWQAENVTIVSQPRSVNKEVSDEKFRPKGAIAFFIVLLIICAAIWYGVYYIQLTRQ